MAKAKKNQDDSVGVDTLSEEDDTDVTEAETDAAEEDAEDTDTEVRDSDFDDDGDSPTAVTASAGASVREKGSRGESAVSDSDSDSARGSSSSGSRPQPVPKSSGGSDDDGSGGSGGSAGSGEPEMRRAHLTLSRVEPWSVMKFSFVISLVCFIILFVAVAVVYVILSALGVFDAITELITSLTDGGEEDDLGLNPETWFSAARVLGYTGLWGAANIVLITALSTFGSMLYNLAADLVGGLDITLSESE